jgi:hypothetical protein
MCPCPAQVRPDDRLPVPAKSPFYFPAAASAAFDRFPAAKKGSPGNYQTQQSRVLSMFGCQFGLELGGAFPAAPSCLKPEEMTTMLKRVKFSVQPTGSI